jgi:uncharacterized protein YecE (DUF72 family)
MEFSVEKTVPKLKELEKQGIYIGTSSWKYEGWIGQVYNKDYSGPRSKVQKKTFQDECLSEFATIFPTVCFDGGFWRFPEPKQLTKYAAQVPDDFRFAIKVTNSISERRDHRGVPNAGFLDARLYREHFFEPTVSALGEKLGPIILEFSPFFFGRSYGQLDYSPLQFVKDLHKFLSLIPKTDAKLSVEVRDPQLITFERYYDCLEHHGVAHVLNQQTWVPTIAEQLEIPNVFPAPHTVIRALVRPGVKHNEAVDEFQPYDRTQLDMPEMREAIAETARLSMAANRKLYAFINNRTEGNAPNTIAGVLQLLYPQK